MKMIDFFIARNCRGGRWIFNHRAPYAVKRADMRDDSAATSILTRQSKAILAGSGQRAINCRLQMTSERRQIELDALCTRMKS
jgi:hypothetical protein